MKDGFGIVIVVFSSLFSLVEYRLEPEATKLRFFIYFLVISVNSVNVNQTKVVDLLNECLFLSRTKTYLQFPISESFVVLLTISVLQGSLDSAITSWLNPVSVITFSVAFIFRALLYFSQKKFIDGGGNEASPLFSVSKTVTNLLQSRKEEDLHSFYQFDDEQSVRITMEESNTNSEVPSSNSTVRRRPRRHLKDEVCLAFHSFIKL